jgi:hypothetical protein
MPQYGSSQNLISTNLSQTVDNQGNPIISSDTGYGASPLGYAARAQALFGLPNSTFELTPPDTTAVISAANPLPYWDVQDYSSGVMSGSAIYDSTTNSWGVNLNPGTATTNDYITMITRSYLINDSNLSLRQQAFAIVSKVGTYSSTTQWNLELTASYYDSTNTLLHSGTVATIYDNATWTSMAGTTTTSGTAINAAAHYVDLQFKLTATAAVTSATSVTIKSVILTTSTGIGKSLLVTETFTSSGTWTRPTGVTTLIGVIAVGGGGGGGGGGSRWQISANSYANGGGGGGSGGFVFIPNLYVGDVATVSVGIGAAGVGGTAGEKVVGDATNGTLTGQTGATGGATTFGAYLTASGGVGGTGGTAGATQPSGTALGGAGGASTTSVFGGSAVAGATGAGATMQGTSVAAGSTSISAFQYFPFSETPAAGAAGGSASTSAGTAYEIGALGVGGSAGYQGGGGAGACAGAAAGSRLSKAAVAAQRGAGGGGAGIGQNAPTSSSQVIRAGAGGSASIGSGAGGGGGGGLGISNVTVNLSQQNYVGGAGGNGASGYVVVAYIA